MHKNITQYLNKKFIFKLAIYILTFILIIIYFHSERVGVRNSLQKVGSINLLIIFILNIVFILIYARYQIVILYPLQIILKTRDAIDVTVKSFIFNNVLPLRGGTVFRGIFLYNKYNISPSLYGSTYGAITLISFLCSALIGILSVIVLYQEASYQYLNILLFIYVCLIFGFILIYLFTNRLIQILNKKHFSKLYNIVEGWSKIAYSKKTVLELMFLMLSSQIITAFTFYILASSIGYSVTIWNACIYATFSTFSLLLNITPGAIGIKEGILIIFNVSIGVDADGLIIISIVERVLFIVTNILILVTHLLYDKFYNKKII